MTLLDAPNSTPLVTGATQSFSAAARARVVVLFVVWWLVAGRPVDWPWNWNHYLFGRIAR